MIQYQDEILQAYLPQLGEQEQKQFIQKYQTLSDEEKEMILHNMATQMPEFQQLLQGQQDQAQMQFGNEQAQQPQQFKQGGMYQNGAEVRDITETGKKPSTDEEIDIFFGDEGEPLAVRNGVITDEVVNPNEWKKIPGGKFKYTSSIANPRGYKSIPSDVDSSDIPAKPATPAAAQKAAAKTVKNANKILKVGEDVKKYQKALFDAGILNKKGNTKNGNWDGLHGRRTEAALTNYMTKNNLSRNKALEKLLGSKPSSKLKDLVSSPKSEPRVDITGTQVNPDLLNNTQFDNTYQNIPDLVQPALTVDGKNLGQSVVSPNVSNRVNSNAYVPNETNDWFNNYLTSRQPNPIAELEQVNQSNPYQQTPQRDIAREIKETGVVGTAMNTIMPNVEANSNLERTQSSLDRLYQSPVYQKAGTLERLAMQLEVDPLSFMGSGIMAGFAGITPSTVYKTRNYPFPVDNYPKKGLPNPNRGNPQLDIPRSQRATRMPGEQVVDPKVNYANPYVSNPSRRLDTSEGNAANAANRKGVNRANDFINKQIEDLETAASFGLDKATLRAEFKHLRERGQFNGTYQQYLDNRINTQRLSDDFGGAFANGGRLRNPYK